MISQQLNNMARELDAVFTKTYEEYLIANRDLEEFHKSIKDPSDEKDRISKLEELNSILLVIQERWGEMIPVFNYIASRYEFTTNAVNSYDGFIKNLEKEIERQKVTQGMS